jgi:hypothetical protein
LLGQPSEQGEDVLALVEIQYDRRLRAPDRSSSGS